MKKIAKLIIINTDGGARGNPGPAGAGVVMADEAGKVVARHKKYLGETTNNQAEYQALILALAEAAGLGAENLQIRMDSELIVRQMQGRYKIKDPELKILAAEAFRLKKNFGKISFVHIPREKNQPADRLVNEAIDAAIGA